MRTSRGVLRPAQRNGYRQMWAQAQAALLPRLQNRLPRRSKRRRERKSSENTQPARWEASIVRAFYCHTTRFYRGFVGERYWDFLGECEGYLAENKKAAGYLSRHFYCTLLITQLSNLVFVKPITVNADKITVAWVSFFLIILAIVIVISLINIADL